MNIFKKNNEKKTTQKLPMTGKVKKGFRAYCAVIAAATLVCGMSVTAFAASGPISSSVLSVPSVLSCLASVSFRSVSL